MANNHLHINKLLITGATGSAGEKLLRYYLSIFSEKQQIIVFSRDEHKQYLLKQSLNELEKSKVRFVLGDVRDIEQLKRTFRGVDVVIHAAVLKHVDIGEENPLEYIKTNVLGTQNVIDACYDMGVKKLISLSTDKAVKPINLYGASKLCAEKLITASAKNNPSLTSMNIIRFGNIYGSRGSVVPLFESLKNEGVIPITHPEMERYFVEYQEVISIIDEVLHRDFQGKIFVPKLKSTKITDLASQIAPNCKQEIIGIREGEKLKEELLSEEELANAQEFDGYYLL